MLKVDQCDMNEHLKGIDLDPGDAVWGSVQDLLCIMVKFLERGGKYENPHQFNGSEDEYPCAAMRVFYTNNNSLLVTKSTREGYAVIKIWYSNPFWYDGNDNSEWDTCLVHPSHLDAALCYLLEVPEPYGMLAKANLVLQICEIITRRGLDQVQAANLLSISHIELVAMISGNFSQYPITKLLGYIQMLEQKLYLKE